MENPASTYPFAKPNESIDELIGFRQNP